MEPQDPHYFPTRRSSDLINTTEDYGLGALATGLSAVAGRMEPKEASRVCAEAAPSIIQAMSKTRSSYRSAEHTYELQSRPPRIYRHLLETYHTQGMTKTT